jgi:hypothetical protein
MFKTEISKFLDENDTVSEINEYLNNNPLPNNNETEPITYNGRNIEDLILDDLYLLIKNNTNTPRLRFGCMERLARDFPPQMNELIEGFRNSYLYAGSSSLEKTLNFIAIKCPGIEAMTRYQVCLTLIHVAERTITKEKDDELEDFREMNIIRFKQAGDILGDFCEKYFNELPSPSKIECVFKFLKIEYHFRHFNKYIRCFLDLPNLKSEYKYNALLSIEKKSIDLTNTFNILWKRSVTKIDGENIPEELKINGTSVDLIPNDEEIIQYHIGADFSQYRINLYQILLKTFIYFLQKPDIEINFRILAAQNCLVKDYISSEDEELAQKVLLEFISDEYKNSLTDQQLADVADVLLQAKNSEVKQKARDMIKNLGFKGSKGKTIFDNAQNVHTKEIEQSVIEILEHLTTLPLARKFGEESDYIDFEFVYEDLVNKMTTAEYYMEEEKRDSVLISLKRIDLDRALYSKMSCTLEKILLRVWSYISKNNYKEELFKRLLEELVDMSGWCSSGYAFRLLNTLSGFGEFSLRISFTDQIIANFQARFIARINALPEEVEDIEKEYTKSDIMTGFTVTMNEDPILRKKFLNFFMIHMPRIREEMWPEFKEYIDDASFDLSFRKAIAQVVEGITLESGIKASIAKQKKKEEKLGLIKNDQKIEDTGNSHRDEESSANSEN